MRIPAAADVTLADIAATLGTALIVLGTYADGTVALFTPWGYWKGPDVATVVAAALAGQRAHGVDRRQPGRC